MNHTTSRTTRETTSPPPEPPAALLRKHFGFEQFLPGQERVIQSVLDGHSAAAVFPTGGGKSLCYQLPALALPGLTLVVSPLIALMKDQIDALIARGIRAQRLDSTLSSEDYRQTIEDLRAGELELLYVAPERFNNERFRGLINGLSISLFAVDEAHCISEWGHNFRPDYLKLARFVRECHAERVLALTATATEAVLDDICQALDIAPEHAVRTPFYRPNLRLLTTAVEARERESVLEELLRERAPGSTIVYVTLQRTAEWLSRRLANAGLDARAYHAGMQDDIRAEVQDWFFASDRAIVVATIAFGMGIDKPDIRYVYHYNLPKSLESYAQEIGRAGRDGEPSVCHMLVHPDDLNTLENFAYGDTPSRSGIEILVREIDRLGLAAGSEFFDVSVHRLSAASDIRILVSKTLLTYLELDGLIEGGTPLYSEFQFQPQMSSQEILAHFEGEQRSSLAQLFRQAKKGRTWFTIEVDQAAHATGLDRARVVRTLDDLNDRGMLELRARGVRQRYRRTEAWQSGTEFEQPLVEALYRRMQQRERLELERLHDVLAWVTCDGCQVSALGARFGEALDQACGHCSHCESGRAVVLAPRSSPGIPEAVWARALDLRAETMEVLGHARSLTRFLCGVTSPHLSKARLSGHELFGASRDVPFGEVLEQARALD